MQGRHLGRPGETLAQMQAGEDLAVELEQRLVAPREELLVVLLDQEAALDLGRQPDRPLLEVGEALLVLDHGHGPGRVQPRLAQILLRQAVLGVEQFLLTVVADALEAPRLPLGLCGLARLRIIRAGLLLRGRRL